MSRAVRKPAGMSPNKGSPVAITTMDRDARLALVADKLRELGKKVQSQSDEDKKRILLVMDCLDVEDILGSLSGIKFQVLEGHDQLTKCPDDNFIIDRRIANIGAVPYVGDVVLYPYTTALPNLLP